MNDEIDVESENVYTKVSYELRNSVWFSENTYNSKYESIQFLN